VAVACCLEMCSAELPAAPASSVNGPAADQKTENDASRSCGGNNHRSHSAGPYTFMTSSWVRAGDNGHYYRTCVQNLSDRDLWFDWFTPGPTTYVPPRESVSSPRYFIDRKSVDFLGCIQYGNHRDPMQEYFIGHENDRQQIDKEKVEGCKVSRSAYQHVDAPAELPKITYFTRLFVPSDSKRVRETLMRLDLTVSLAPSGNARASSTVRYVASGYYPQSVADPTRVTLRPNSEILRAALARAEIKDGQIRLTGGKGEISLTVPMPPKFSISNARYNLYDQNELLVGAVFVPVPEPLN